MSLACLALIILCALEREISIQVFELLSNTVILVRKAIEETGDEASPGVSRSRSFRARQLYRSQRPRMLVRWSHSHYKIMHLFFITVFFLHAHFQ